MFSRSRHRPSRATRASYRLRIRWRLCLAAVLAVALAGCAPSGVPTPQPSPSALPVTTAATSSPTAPSDEVWVTAYYMSDTRAGFRLTRERQQLRDGSATAVIQAMIAGPIDPDYATPWNPLTQVLSVSEDSGVITVDLSGDAVTANVGSEGAALMIQQLVWTVTGAMGMPDASVTLLIDGAPSEDLWGVMRWDDPVVRADPLEVRALVQLDVPAEGEVFPAGAVEISGDAAAFEANVPWRITSGGAEVASGFATTSEGQQFAPFSFTVDLTPGTYIVEIVEDDPSDGEGGTPMKDTRTFTVETA